jgi:hypothetical protein
MEYSRLMRWIVTTVTIGVMAWALPAAADAADLTCSSATNLDALATCVRGQMPASGSGGYVAPTAVQQTDWRTVVQQMLGGSCSATLPASLAGIMQRRTFTDASNARSYCLLMEVRDADSNGKVDRGWGTFIVYANASRELSHHAPHPIADSTTENQAIGVFRDTDSRSYLMAGAHRLANSGASSCQSGYGPADAAHNVDNMFQATNAELMAHYGTNDWWAVQWHGMAADTCTAAQVYLSHGRNVLPASGDKIAALKSNLLAHHPTWAVQTTGTGACTLNATDNTQGRLINGVAPAQVCGTAASSYTGRFLHVEQDPGFRAPADWVQAVNDTWPTIPPLPPAPAGLSAAAGNAQVSLTWSPAPAADTYRVHRSTTSGGPYETIASGLAATSHVDTTVTNGTTYYYVVSGVNEGGEGTDSTEVSATPQALALPAAPTGLSAAAGKKRATLSWSAVAGAASYRLKRSTTSGGPYAVVASNVTGTTFTNTGLASGTTYYYVVSAVNAVGEGANSAQVSVRAR